nr:double-stranded RNA binding motif domain-containing protein [Kribbella solani]
MGAVSRAQSAPTQTITGFLRTRRTSSPISAVHELAQAGHLAPPEWSHSRTGPAHRPAFTCVLAVRRSEDDKRVEATATESSKRAAQTDAADIVLTMLRELDRER